MIVYQFRILYRLYMLQFTEHFVMYICHAMSEKKVES